MPCQPAKTGGYKGLPAPQDRTITSTAGQSSAPQGETSLRGKRRGPSGAEPLPPAAARASTAPAGSPPARDPVLLRRPGPRKGFPPSRPRREPDRAVPGSGEAPPAPRRPAPPPPAAAGPPLAPQLGSSAPALPAARPRPLPHVCKVLGVRPGVAAARARRWRGGSRRPGPGTAEREGPAAAAAAPPPFPAS